MALDGELFAGRGEFKCTVSITRRKNGGEQWRDRKYVIFDAPSVVGGFEVRLAAAESVVSELEFVDVHPHSSPYRDMDHVSSPRRCRIQGWIRIFWERKRRPLPIGTVISYRYCDTTKAGAPRFPIYLRVRADVDAADFE
jgi:hypothetical protein